MTEIKKTGNRYYYFSREQFRSFPMKKVEAEALLASGEGFLVKSFMNEPGGFQPIDEEPAPEAERQEIPIEKIMEQLGLPKHPEPTNVVDFMARKREREAAQELADMKAHFLSEILPQLTPVEMNKLAGTTGNHASFREEMLRVMLRLKMKL